MNLLPIGDNLIVVRRVVKSSGIIETPEEQSILADVVSIGPRVQTIIPGETIVLPKTAGKEVTISHPKFGTGTFIVVQEKLIVAIYTRGRTTSHQLSPF